MAGLDWIIAVLVLVFTWNGYRAGLVKQVFQVLSVFASYYVAKTYTPQVVPFIMKQIPQSIPKTPVQDSSALPFNAGGLTDSATNGLQMIAAHSLAYAVSFALLFLITYVLIRAVATFANGIASLPVLAWVNRIAGACVGLVLAVVLQSIALHLLWILPIQSAHQAISHSGLAHSLLNIHIWPFSRQAPASGTSEPML